MALATVASALAAEARHAHSSADDASMSSTCALCEPHARKRAHVLTNSHARTHARTHASTHVRT
eukprot:699570-Pleurochrysis_carterae.AAC.1